MIDANEHLRVHGLLGEKDELRDTFNVDMEAFNNSLEEFRHSDGITFIDSHLAHQCDCSRIIVLRCEPHVLAERLRKREYSKRKVLENVQAEVLGIILCESTDSDIPVSEINCTSGAPSEAVDLILRIISTDPDLCQPGSIDWSREMEEWF